METSWIVLVDPGNKLGFIPSVRNAIYISEGMLTTDGEETVFTAAMKEQDFVIKI